MATNDEPTTDEPTDEQLEAWRTEPGESVADVEPPAEYLDEFPRWNGTVDVVIPNGVARAIAHRVGARAATGDTATERTVYDFAYDHAQVAERFLVPADDWREPNVPLVEWVEQQGVPVDRTEGDSRDGERTGTPFTARAEYRPGEDVPLVITLDVPDRVLKEAGGFEELTDTARLQLGDE